MNTLRELFWGENAYRTYWYVFLIALPFSWRSVLIPSVGGGAFNEYTDISLYIGDILILCTFITLQRHELLEKSIHKARSLFHVKQMPIILLILWLLGGFFWSESKLLWMDSMVTILRIFLVSIVFFRIISISKSESDSTWNILRVSVYIFCFSILVQLLVASTQFITNESVGIHILGESVLSSSLSGVAKIDYGNQKQIRSYGTFLHPNILAGYLVVILLIVQSYFQMFHVEKKWWPYLFVFGSSALVMTFSKSGLIAVFLCIVLIMFHVEKSKPFFKKMFHVENLFLTLAIMLVATGLIWQKQSSWNQSIQERIDIVNLYDVIKGDQIYGTGLGQSVFLLKHKLPQMEAWQYQPIHNVYIILFRELGIIGLSLIALVSWAYVPRGTRFVNSVPIFAIGIIGLFDHYPLDIYMGNILLALSLAWLWQGSEDTV